MKKSLEIQSKIKKKQLYKCTVNMFTVTMNVSLLNNIIHFFQKNIPYWPQTFDW